jgi:hypothetical protein
LSETSDEEKVMEAVRAAAEKRGVAPSGEGLPEALPIDWSTEPTPASANGVQVLHGPQHFALLYTDMQGFAGRSRRTARWATSGPGSSSSLRMDPGTYFQVLAAMASNWNKYVEAHVPPQMRQPRFKLIDAGDAQLYGFEPPKDD